MEITTEQKEAISQWIADGASIADVQKRLMEDFSVNLTYMDARFLIDDLELSLKDSMKISPHTDLGGSQAGGAPPPPAQPAPAPPAAPGQGPGAVSVEVDKITQPGMAVSGSVVFSDGVSATWGLDQAGRIALNAGQSGYQPAPEDVEAFQQALSQQLQRQGY